MLIDRVRFLLAMWPVSARHAHKFCSCRLGWAALKRNAGAFEKCEADQKPWYCKVQTVCSNYLHWLLVDLGISGPVCEYGRTRIMRELEAVERVRLTSSTSSAVTSTHISNHNIL